LLITVACCLAGWRHATIYQQEAICLAAPILFIGMAIKAWQIKYKPAIVFIIAWGALIVSIVLFALTNMGVLPYGRWTFHLLPIGSAIEVVMLSKALWYRYALKEKARRAKQEMQIQSATEQNTLLEQKVGERTQALQTALELLEENNQAKDKMLNIIAHDIRSPLNNLSGYLELAEKRVVEAGQVQQFVQVLRRNISQIGKTMNNLLNWSLVQKNLIETVPAEVVLSPMIRQIMDTYRFSAEEKGVNLKKNMPEELVVVADVHQLELVLRNLLDNAIKFTPRGGAITIGCRPKAGQVVIYVSDTGNGMLQEEAEKLLNKSSFHTTGHSSNGKGTGLGLQLCKEFVASNGGVLQVKSVPGEGTEFYFSLPGKLQL
jgi:two-component system, sensor histidine kinase LadS